VLLYLIFGNILYTDIYGSFQNFQVRCWKETFIYAGGYRGNMAGIIEDIIAFSNQVLLDGSELLGVSVWTLIIAMAVSVIILLLVAIWLIERRHEVPVDVYTDEGKIEFVEKTLAEFPADRIRIEGKKGKVVINLISPKPIPEGEALPPQEIKGEPLPSKTEVPKPPVSKEPEKAPKEEPKSKPIAMGAVGPKPKKEEKKK
jgi:hypothetical protein